jgi:transposase
LDQSTMYVGMDVHKESIDVALAPAGVSETRPYGRIAGDLDAVDKIVKRLREQHQKLNVVYEAGPCGYALQRHLTRRGIACAVVAPSMIPKRPGDRIKTDRRDAISLARLHRAGELTAVYIPSEEDEAIRDLTRSREDAVASHKRARLQLGALLLRHNIRYTGRSTWTPAHRRWLSEVVMPQPAQQIVFQEYVKAAEETHERVLRITEQVRVTSTTWRMAPVVEALQALRGVSLIVATTVLAELGDLTRFDNPRQLMAFLGLVPSQYSSGPRERFGHITKTGNGHARRVLVEAAWAYHFPAKVARALQLRQENLPANVRDIAWRAQLRLCKRYRRLLARGKTKQVIVTAIARELAGFSWAIAKEVKPVSV